MSDQITKILGKENPVSVEKLVETTNYAVVYASGNYGLDHLMFMMFTTDLEPGSQESKMNQASIYIIDGAIEEAAAVDQWLGKHSDLPFIVSGYSLLDCAAKMDGLVRAYGTDWDKFFSDLKIYNDWRNVVYYVVDGPDEDAMYDLWHNGWESLIDKANKWLLI